MHKKYKVGDTVVVTDTESQYHGKRGEIKSQSDSNPNPPTGHTGKIWNVQLQGVTGETKLDEAHMDHVV